MAYKTLIFGVDDLFYQLEPFYDEQVQRGILDIVAYAVFEQGGIKIVPINQTGGGILNVDIAIISSWRDFYNRMKRLESMGVPRNKIIDGRVFKVPQLNVPRLLAEGIAYGVFDDKNLFESRFMIYPRVFGFKNSQAVLQFGAKSYIGHDSVLEGDDGQILIGNFSALSWRITFELGSNYTHNYHNVSAISINNIDWPPPENFYPPQGVCKILIGNDVWIGRGCIFKSTNPNRPLVVGDGAVVASDSVVVKNVPPYAIVGGNPAQIIKYRFKPEVIEALLRIKWWDWSLDKIHDNFKYFNDIDKFISIHDR